MEAVIHATANACMIDNKTSKIERTKHECTLQRAAGVSLQRNNQERRQGHMKDALALGGDEGRDKLR